MNKLRIGYTSNGEGFVHIILYISVFVGIFQVVRMPFPRVIFYAIYYDLIRYWINFTKVVLTTAYDKKRPSNSCALTASFFFYIISSGIYDSDFPTTSNTLMFTFFFVSVISSPYKIEFNIMAISCTHPP
jgi:hypothetical protein